MRSGLMYRVTHPRGLSGWFGEPPVTALGRTRALRWSWRTRVAWSGFGLLVVVALYAALYPSAGPGLAAIEAVPVGVAGWLLGPLGGVVSAALALMASNSINAANGDSWWPQSGGFGSVILFLTGLGTGWLRVLVQRIEGQRALLAALAREMRQGLLLFDPQGRVALANEQAGELLGFGRDGLAGRSNQEIEEALRARAEEMDVAVSAWSGALRGANQRPRFTLKLLHPTRRVLDVEAMTVVAQEPAAPQVCVLLHDVTDAHDLERARADLLAMVSHELRGPLTVLTGWVELLRVRPFSEEARREILETMDDEGKRLVALVNDFLDLQRLESGRIPLRLGPVHLAAVVERTVTAAGPSQLHPTAVEVPDDLPPVRGDAERLQQAFGNLLSNARKYSPSGGRVCISAARTADCVKVSIRDQGLGLPASALPRLFGQYYRVEGEDRRGIRGTGLGLFITRRIVDAHGGSIWAESDGPGRGSTFCITLPVHAPAPAA